MQESLKSSALGRGLQSASPADSRSGIHSAFPAPRRFEFERDSFGFANELLWEYRFDATNGTMTVLRRTPKPDYVLRCFVLTRAARQFLYHARFEPERSQADDRTYRRLVREVIGRNPRVRCAPDKEVVIPGFEGLREFSIAWEQLLKSECGGAWRSYFLRSHWRMTFPVSREHQARTAAQLIGRIRQGLAPTIHLVRFPQLDMNHGMILFAVEEMEGVIRFQAYDPNDPEKPSVLSLARDENLFAAPQPLLGGRDSKHH